LGGRSGKGRKRTLSAFREIRDSAATGGGGKKGTTTRLPTFNPIPIIPSLF
jgi:hypothetical protein